MRDAWRLIKLQACSFFLGVMRVQSAHASRRSVLLAAVGTLTATQTPAARASDVGSALPRVRLALAASQSLYHLPLTLADRLGFFRQAGVQLEWLPQESGAKALSLALSGQADVVAGAFEHLFGLHLKGLNYQSFVQMSRTPQVSLGGSTRGGLAWRSGADIRGARLGISALDSTTHWTACQWLRRQGLSVDDVVFVPVGSSQGVMEALRSGSIDALCNPDPVMYWLEQKNDIRLLGDARTLQGTRQLMGGSVPGASLLAHADFLQQHPDRAQALSDGVVQALKWLQTAGLTDILRTVPASHWMGDRAIYLGAFEKLRESYAVDGLVRSEDVNHAWRVHAKLIGTYGPRQLVPERTFTNAFVQKSRARWV
jgi:NitT/TauT family transport system substrate-binding protein